MPAKRKDEKKQEEDIDLSTLPPWISILTMIEWESSLSEVASLFPIYQFSLITRAELFAYSKEKGLISSTITEATIPVQTLAKALSDKISFLDLQGRKQKREQLSKLDPPERARPDSRQASQIFSEFATSPQLLYPQKPDKVYILLNFPRTLEEILATARYGINIQFFYYIRPEPISSHSQFLPNFKEALQKSDKNSCLRTFVDRIIVYDISKYQGMEGELAKLEETKLDKAESVVSAETENKVRSSKTMKKVVKEARDEVVTPQLPDLRKLFIAELVKLIMDLGTLYVKYLVWRDNVPSKPLFPSGSAQEVLETTSNTTVSYNGEIGRQGIDLPSLDDAPKPWDFRVFYFLFNRFGDELASPMFYLACTIQQIQLSENYLKDCSLPQIGKDCLVPGNDFLSLLYKNIGFISGPASESLYRLFENFNFPVSCKNEQTISSDLASHFFSIERNELKWAIMLTRFEELILSHTGKATEINREFGERLPKVVLNAKIQQLLKYSPEVIFCKHDNATLLCFLYDSSGPSSRVWEHTKKIRPNFQDWKEFFIYPSEFYDIDELKVGQVNSQETLLYPSNGGVLKSIKYSIANKNITRCIGLLRDWVFGIQDGGKEAFAVLDGYRLVADESSIKVSNRGNIVVCSLNEVLQELTEKRMEYRLEIGGKSEKNRVVTGKGSVIRYLEEDKIQVLFANGNISEFDGTWVVTNNKGMQTCKGETIKTVPCASVTDPSTGLRTTFRDDGTNILYFTDKTVVEFHDGTKILTTPEEFLIESPGYAPVIIFKGTTDYQVILDSQSLIKKSTEKIEILLKNQKEKAEFDQKSLKIDSFVVKFDDSTICCTDESENFMQIGLYQEPKQVIIQKSSDFKNHCHLYIVEESGEGIEILEKAEILKTLDPDSTKFASTYDNKTYEIYYKSENEKSMNKGHLDSSFLHTYTYSNIFSQIKPEPLIPESDPRTHYSYRYFEKYPKFTPDKRKKFGEQYKEYKKWQSKQILGKEFGFSEFCPISYQIHRNDIYEKIKSRTEDRTLKKPLKDFVEESVKDQIWGLKKSEKNLENIQPELSECDSPIHPVKTRKNTMYSGSINSTMHSFNYFKSPEGPDLSFVSPPSVKASTLPQTEVKPEVKPYPKTQAKKLSKPENLVEESYEDNPFISLVPTKGKKVVLKPVIKTSVFSQLEKLQKLRETSEKNVAEEYHVAKNMNFDLIGSIRKSLPNVSALRSTSPATSKINLKYLNSEILTETKIRTISQTRRSIFKQPNSSTYRRESNHRLSKSVIIDEYVNDPMRRLLEIVPKMANFGNVLVGQVASVKLIVKNEDSTLVRFVVKQPNIKEAKVVYRPGPIAPGMITKFIVEVNSKEAGEIKGDFEVLCKSEIYSIPIFVNFVSDKELVVKKEMGRMGIGVI